MELEEAIEKSCRQLKKIIPRDILLEFSQAPVYHITDYKSGIGTIIRIKLLKDRNILYKSFVKSGITDRDAMVGIVLWYLYQHIKTKGPDENENGG